MKATAKQHFEDPRSRGYMLEDVTRHRSVSCRVQKVFTIMNKKEAAKYMGQDIKAKDPAVKTVEIINQQEEAESVMVFADEQQPHRKLILESDVGEDTKVHLMDAETHVHADQGKFTMTASTTKRMRDSDIASLLTPGAAHQIVTPEEYREKLLKKHCRVPHTGPENEQSRSEFQDDEGAKSAEVINVYGEEDSALACAASSSMASGLERHASQMLGTGEPAESPPAKDACAKKRLSAKGKPGTSPSTPGGSACSGASAAGLVRVASSDNLAAETDVCSMPDQYLTDSQICTKWVRKLDLQETLEGKKLGVQRSHALNAVKKVEVSYGNIIKGHVALFDMAKLLSAEEQPFASVEDIVSAVKELSENHDLKWPRDVLQALHERQANHLQDCATSVLAVMSSDAFAMLPAVEAVDKIRKHFRSTTQKPLAMIASALADSSYWLERITTFIQVTCTLKVHRNRIDDLQAFVKTELVQTQDEALKLLEMVRSLVYLQEELASSESMKELSTPMAGRVSSFWQGAKEHLHTAEPAVSVKTLQELLSEAELAFPQQAPFAAFTLELAEILKTKSGEEKIRKLMEIMPDLWDMQDLTQYDDEKNEAIMETMGACRGLKMSAADSGLYRHEMLELAKKLPGIIEDNHSLALRLEKVLRHGLEWMDPEFEKHLFAKNCSLMRLRECVDAYKCEHSSVLNMVQDDPSKSRLADMMRAEKSVIEKDWVGAEVASRIMKEARHLKEESKKIVVDGARACLAQAVADLRPHAGGGPGGQAWCEGVPNDWASVMAAANSTLMQSNGGKVKSLLDPVDEVPARKFPRNSTQTSYCLNSLLC